MTFICSLKIFVEWKVKWLSIAPLITNDPWMFWGMCVDVTDYMFPSTNTASELRKIMVRT